MAAAGRQSRRLSRSRCQTASLSAAHWRAVPALAGPGPARPGTARLAGTGPAVGTGHAVLRLWPRARSSGEGHSH